MARWTLKRWAGLESFPFPLSAGVILLALSWGAVSIPAGTELVHLVPSFLGMARSGFFFAPGDIDHSRIAFTESPFRGPRRARDWLLRGPSCKLFCGILWRILLSLGISSGAALGAVLAILFGLGGTLLGSYIVPGTAFVAALLTIFFVYSIARVAGRVPSKRCSWPGSSSAPSSPP